MARLCLAFLALSLLASAQKQKTWTDAEVLKVHRSALLIDGHNDTPLATVQGIDLGQRRSTGHTDLPRLREGGVGAVFFAAYVGAEAANQKVAAHRVLAAIDTIRRDIAEKHPREVMLAVSAAGILQARKQHKFAALIGVENGQTIEDDLRLLRDYYALGARYMTLTHSSTSTWADSSGDINNSAVEHHNGLTDLGRQVVQEMNRIGMMVDLAHVSDKTFWDAIEVSRAPVFSSHSGCRAVSNIGRNMTDDMIKAVAKKGGLVMVNFGCEFLSQKSADTSAWTNPAIAEKLQQRFASISDPRERRSAYRKALEESDLKMTRATIDDVVAHIDHIRSIAGIGAVGIGTDFDGISCTPEGLDDVSKFPNLTRKLLEKGYNPQDIRKIYGANLLRFMRAVEDAAEKPAR